MDAVRDRAAEPLIVDDSACAAYVREIRELLAADLFAMVVNGDGRVLWSDDSVRQSQHEPALRAIPAPADQASMHVLAPNWVAYQLPLSHSRTRSLALRIALHDATPPGLSDLRSLIEQTLACLARQIEIDTSLTCSRIAKSLALDEVTELDDLLAASADAFEIPQSLESICRKWRQIADVPCAAISLSDPQTHVDDCRIDALHGRVADVMRRMRQKMNGTQQAVRSRMRTADGRSLTLILRNISGAAGAPIGCVLIADSPSNTELPRLSRQLAARLGQWLNRPGPESRLLSRSELLEAIGAAWRKGSERIHSLLYLDADRIHTINDAFGYSAGDRALEKLGDVLQEDAGASALAAHLSSDRFAVFLPGTTSDQAVTVAQRILRNYSQHSIDDAHKSIGFSASAGIASTLDEREDAENLLIVAEVAARAAKDRGGNQYALHEDIDDSVIKRRSDVDKVGFMQMALIENKFVLFAQKISALAANRPDKYELLTRLELDGNTIGHPGDMLSAAERYHMMTALDRWVINSALASLAAVDNALDVNLSTFCINVSAQSLQDDSFIDHIETRIAETGVAADTLCFEITETSLVRNIESAQHFISRLQRLGCQVALDDFGTGYSSFAYLKNLPVNYLKIDGSFVRDMLENPLSRAIVSSIVNIAAVTGSATVAEHVESDALASELRELGIDYVQGFAVHRPEPFSNVLGAMNRVTYASIEEENDFIDLDEYTRPTSNQRWQTN